MGGRQQSEEYNAVGQLLVAIDAALCATSGVVL